jgi:hypothetical protein
MTLQSTIYVGANTHVVEVQNLKDSAGITQTDATVTLSTITDLRTGVQVAGISFPILLAHIGSGLYRGLIPHDAGFIANRVYSAAISAVSSAGYRALWDERLVAKVRNA